MKTSIVAVMYSTVVDVLTYIMSESTLSIAATGFDLTTNSHGNATTAIMESSHLWLREDGPRRRLRYWGFDHHICYRSRCSDCIYNHE